MLSLHMDDIVFVHYGFHGPKSIALFLVFFFIDFFQIFTTTAMCLGHLLVLNLHMDDIEFTFWLFKAIVHYPIPFFFFPLVFLICQ